VEQFVARCHRLSNCRNFPPTSETLLVLPRFEIWYIPSLEEVLMFKAFAIFIRIAMIVIFILFFFAF